MDPEIYIEIFTGEELVHKTNVDKVALALASLCGNQGDGIDRNLRRFRLMRDSTETDSRMILDAILQPLCAANGLTLRCEQTLTCDELPNSRYDYIIYYEKNRLVLSKLNVKAAFVISPWRS